jgi:hypothetical protein
MINYNNIVYFKYFQYTQGMKLPGNTQRMTGNTYYLDEVCFLCKMQGQHDSVESLDSVEGIGGVCRPDIS